MFFNTRDEMQDAAVQAVANQDYRGTVIAGVGCHVKDTGILMYDGSIKKVQDIRTNDVLMGNDSTPRTVNYPIKGYGKIYKIENPKGDIHYVNEDHILRVFLSSDRTELSMKYFNISVKELLKMPKRFQRDCKMVTAPSSYPKKDVLIDPYFLGIWLGDGSSSGPTVTTMDKEVADYCYKTAKYYNCIVNKLNIKNNKASTYFLRRSKTYVFRENGYPSSILADLFYQYNLINNKHIPENYLINDRETRLKLLAGLIDSDGHYRYGYYEITQKSKTLAYQINRLARSLGYHAVTKEVFKRATGTKHQGSFYFRTSIIGNGMSEIPVLLERKKATDRTQKKNPMHHGIKITEHGYDNFYGFNLDGNNLYLDENHFIHHNSGKSRIGINAAKKYEAEDILIIVPFDNLIENWLDECDKFELERKRIKKIICDKSLHKENLTDYDFIIWDEVHHCTELNTKPFYDAPYLPAIVGLTGTPPIDDFKNKFLDDIIPICFNFPLEDSVKNGFVADYRIILCPFEPDNVNKTMRAGSKNSGYFYITEKQHLEYIDQKIQKQRAFGDPKLLYFERSRALGKLPTKIQFAKTLSDLIKDQRHMIFTNTQVAAESMCESFYHSKTTDEKLQQFLNNEIDRVSVVFAADEGLNVDQIDAGIITNYFSKTRSFIQRLGRILRRKDGKPAIMYCIYAKGTSEEKQLKEALTEFDQSKIAYL